MNESSPAIEAVGVLGGTFDPVHHGHLHIATEARRCLDLPRTLLLPTANPPHKPRGALSPAHHREAMLRLAIRDRERLDVCSLELNPDRVSYTIDTLRRLRHGDSPCLPVFILGMDALAQITTWHEWRGIVREFDLAVMDRIDSEGRNEAALDPEVAGRLVTVDEGASPAALEPGHGGRVFRLPLLPLEISSSTVRARARAGDDLGSLVPPGVARYIHDTGLYRREEQF